MASVYILMKHMRSPVAITYPHPHKVYARKKDAHAACERMNAKAVSNTYWVSKVEWVPEGGF